MLLGPHPRHLERLDGLEADHAVRALVEQARQVGHAASQRRFGVAWRGRSAGLAQAGLSTLGLVRFVARLEQDVAVIRSECALGVTLMLALLPLVVAHHQHHRGNARGHQRDLKFAVHMSSE